MFKSNKMKRALLAALLISLITAALYSGSYYGILGGGAARLSAQISLPISLPSVPLGSLPSCGLLSVFASSDMMLQITTQTPWYCPINEQITLVWLSYMPLAAAAVLLSFAVAGLIFIVGIVTKSDRVREFGIGELYEAFASGIIVFAFLYICAVLFGLTPAFVVGPINPYATAFNLMLSTIHQAEVMYDSLYQATLLNSFYASISVTLDVPLAKLSLPLFIPQYAAFLQLAFIEPAYALSSFISDAILVIYSEYYLLVFFSVAAIPVFLVPGVILRAIFPTRALGGMLVAMAMAFYLIVPTLFSVAYYFTAPGAIRNLATVNTLLSRYSSGSGAITNAITTTSPLILQLQDITLAMNAFWLLMLFYPMLIIAVTYAFIVQVANFIGGAAQKTPGRLRGFI